MLIDNPDIIIPWIEIMGLERQKLAIVSDTDCCGHPRYGTVRCTSCYNSLQPNNIKYDYGKPMCKVCQEVRNCREKIKRH